jgi:hypothetical protein
MLSSQEATSNRADSSLPRFGQAWEGDCGICLGTQDLATHTTLSCGHGFCPPCLHRHIVAEFCKGNRAWCPSCRQTMEEGEIAELCPEALAEARAQVACVLDEVPAPPETWWQRRMHAHRFRQVARRANLKYCPSCRSTIEKNAGCNHMTCRCGHEFLWDAAERVAPCLRCHPSKKGLPIWGSTCPGCTRLAKASLAATRTLVVIGAVPVAAIALPVLPFVVACKSVRRWRRRRLENRFMLADSLIYEPPQTYSPELSFLSGSSGF